MRRSLSTFSADVVGGSVNFAVKNAANATVAGSVAYSSTTHTATFTPSAALAAGGTYTATVSGAQGSGGGSMAAPVSWSFTTQSPGSCPCSIFASDAIPATPSWPDTTAVEVGVQFTADQSGHIAGIRFYKGANNTGTHRATLWSSSGTALATATFTNETATGWQTVNFSSPVSITAGTTYVASYFAPNGGYAADPGYFNGGAYNNAPLHALAASTPGGDGVYAVGGGFPNTTYNGANYWVDVVLTS